MRTALCLALSGLFASGAVAQTTDCTTLGAFTHCSTIPPPAPPPVYQPPPTDWSAFGRAIAEMRARREARKEREAEAARQQQESTRLAQEDANMRYIGHLIEGGECESAKSIALTNGKIDLASKIDSLCHQRQLPPIIPVK